MKPALGALRVFDDQAALARGAADFLDQQARASTGSFVVALSGGSTPKSTYELLAEPPIRDRFPWIRVHWVLGDERFVDAADPASNFGMICAAFLSHVPAPPANIHPVPFNGLTPEQAVDRYEATLARLYGADTLRPDRMLLDVNLLGLGDDGHTASLIPGQPVLAERDRWVAAVEHGRAEPRITLTYPALESSRVTVVLVAGVAKRAILDTVLSGGSDVPAARLRPKGELIWFVDRAAAGRWGA
ncbi:MAG: 6-phosphogluconolactonase [Alphaproteobacteria bacterium]|nr:6-phosphogluconolactonase [Alphaproteobacteria bacterium]